MGPQQNKEYNIEFYSKDKGKEINPIQTHFINYVHG